MSRRPLPRPPHPVPTGTESREHDRWAIDVRGVPSAALMERAGMQAATLVHRHLGVPPDARVVALAGSGDNGGDARILARCLEAWGRDVRLLETSTDDRSGLLTRDRLRAEPTSGLTDTTLADLLRGADVVVDGMLGTGASGELRGEVGRVAAVLAELGGSAEAGRAPVEGWAVRGARVVVALDVPTGVDADSGAVAQHAVRADATIAFGWPKLGSLLHPARERVGRLVSVEIGFPPLGGGAGDTGGPGFGPGFTWAALDAAWARSVLPVRAADTHKNAAGPVLVVAGSEGMAGAAILAGRAALRAGAGYLRIASVPSNRQAVQAGLPEAVWVDRGDPDALGASIGASRAVVVGPGIGTDAAAAAVLRTVLEASLPVVVDADALTLLARGAVEFPSPPAWSPPGASSSPRASSSPDADGAPRVLTPHPGEAARLLGVEPSDVQADRPAALERLRGTTGAIVLLKGSPSLVAGVHRRLDPTGSSDLATAGVGDVLAGTIGALIARGVDAEDAASLGLWLTSSAARLAGRGAGLQSGDLPDHLPAAMAECRAGPRATPIEPWVTLDLPPIRVRPGAT